MSGPPDELSHDPAHHPARHPAHRPAGGRAHDPAPPVPPAARNVPALLLALHRTGFTGSVTVSSAPGGTIHLEQGLVTAIETPGAPTAETLLLKARRVGEADWATAETAASAARPVDAPAAWGGDLGAALVAQGSIGATELEAVCAAAAFDGAFALVLSPPGSWEIAESAPPARIALCPGIEPQRLFEETARRVALLTRLWGPPGELARTRIRPAAAAESAASRIPVRYREVLAAATGRRTPRDIGFALGRGVFSVLLDVVRMDARHLLHRETALPAATAPSVAPRTPPSGPLPTATGPLPRRVPGVRGAGSAGGHGRPDSRPEEAAGASDGPPNAHRTETTETTEKSRP
ncbi:DUF4388 domain-containing protein [Kitasatospora sp. NPDC058406]|uniref:DUF4388 domain-containing protein n=1 Tax=Kitasatospora sp. NPDC058406 TaxID=3346483 RepID=UPI00365CE31C